MCCSLTADKLDGRSQRRASSSTKERPTRGSRSPGARGARPTGSSSAVSSSTSYEVVLDTSDDGPVVRPPLAPGERLPLVARSLVLLEAARAPVALP